MVQRLTGPQPITQITDALRQRHKKLVGVIGAEAAGGADVGHDEVILLEVCERWWRGHGEFGAESVRVVVRWWKANQEACVFCSCAI